jgi:exopolysaccharide production protein ExoZ
MEARYYTAFVPQATVRRLMKSSERLNSIHFLRFVAAAAVVMHHVTTGLGQKTVLVGAAGVDIFFVISGLVIGMALIDQETPYRFAVRRLIRVLPPYWIATMAVVLFQYSVWGTRFDATTIVRSLLFWPKFGSDWHLIYFPAWTLCYEMLFYASAFLALVVARRHALITCLCVMTLIGLFRIPVPGASNGAFFSTAVSLEFCGGMLLAVLVRSGWRPSRIVGLCMLGVAAAMLWRYQSYVLLISERANMFHLARPLGLGIPSCLLALGVIAFESAPVFNWRIATLGGNASYAIYLCHITVIDFATDRLARHGIQATDHFWLSSFSLVLLSIGVGICFWLAIEKPLLRTLQRLFITRNRKNEYLKSTVTD